MIQNLKFARINTDADEHELKPEQGEYRMMENLVPPERGVGRGYARNSMDGTIETTIDDVDYPLSRITLGSFEDKPTGLVYFFIWASNDFHRIMEYNPKTNVSRRITRSNAFNWTPETKITGIAVLDGVIYFTDPVLQYVVIQDQTQFAEIDYNVRELTSATTETFYFTASLQAGVNVNFQHNVTGPLSATAVAQNVITALLLDSNFVAQFDATLGVGSTVIKITAKVVPGTVTLTNTQDTYYSYYQTNFVREPASPEDYLLYPIPPAYKPLLTGVVDSSIAINKIISNNWQFAYRVIYLNNQISVFSPFSETYQTPKFPEKITDTSINNKIRVQVSIPKPDYTKTIEIVARTSEVGNWFVVKSIDRSEFFGSNGIYVYEFTGTEQQIAVATADAIKQQEGTPRESTDLQLQKNKLFVIDSLTGFDYEANEMSLDVTLSTVTYVTGKTYPKEGGLYNLAVRFFDEHMKTDGTVHKSIQINVPDSIAKRSGVVDPGKDVDERPKIDAVVAGKPPIWAHFWTFVRSDELKYNDYAQFYAYILYYVRPRIDSDDPDTDETYYYWMYGNKYLIEGTTTPTEDWRYIHVLLPTNLSIVPKRGMIMRILSTGDWDAAAPLEMMILDVQGTIAILEKPDGFGAGSYPSSFETIFFELYDPKTTAEVSSFYEVGGTNLVENPGTDIRAFGTYSGEIDGGVKLVNNQDDEIKWKYDWDDYYNRAGPGYGASGPEDQGLVESKFRGGWFESYTPSFQPTKIEEREIELTENQKEFFELDTEFTLDFGYINDYNFASRNLGRPAPLLQNVREESRPSTLRWSNDYVANAAINGLHTFEPLNEYPLPLERGAITKLQRAGEDVMLAIHRAGVTSMYIGKGIIRSADLDPTLVTTTDVVGTDNELKHSYGSVHPESVTEVDGNVYFWDGSRNEPVRYAQNGLTPLATTFFTKVFFKKTLPGIFGSPDQYSCKTGYDRLLDMVWWNFDDGTNKLTIGFHETEKAWICKAGFTPECFGSSGEKFLGFVNGVPWVHNADPVNINTFYGTYYPSKATLLINIGDRLEKAWDGIVVDSNKKWDCPMIYNEEGQNSNLIANDFVWKDNLYYADFLRDINTPVELLKTGQIAIRHGKFLSSQVLTIEMELNDPTYHYLQSIGVSATMKAGHNLQAEQEQR